uniref:PDZ domain-containing protein n=1 Tax=Phaeomonas parva TaxID=124430 RepID=A0A7S1XJK9_9STRA|mmetsp:Transcript_0/g.2  ORF Transcript_0/g.2 Transcript_0/m.2 type:complete len:286 (+) Transcript_0:230-1087(+)|eukprot:CAMPEP_0118876526 /NCGR_PEP_ID=MMETSP1163-20130328/17186_1 /TAXON_ID=124430 /ORGANISM="Phaeomonas parva, Strain CCMP2877" /LENGTH=285 /DNA_ID=CAMNT_0006812145 /DNA_START=119 /DNA_END=976 /DNA_ORIENTATION=+
MRARSPAALTALVLVALVGGADGFKYARSFATRRAAQLRLATAARATADSGAATATAAAEAAGVVRVQLEKPLGMVLEEAGEEGAAAGVVVVELAPDGAAARDGRVREGMALLEVAGQDVGAATFDEAMDALIGAPSVVELVLQGEAPAPAAEQVEPEEEVPAAVAEDVPAPAADDAEDVDDGRPASVVVDGSTKITVERGEILRNALRGSKVDVYDLMGKVTNCNGAGQCGTCAVAVLGETDALSERTDAELRKLGKKPDNWRLACQVVVEGGGELEIQTKPWQ